MLSGMFGKSVHKANRSLSIESHENKSKSRGNAEKARRIKDGCDLVRDLESFDDNYVVCIVTNGWSWGMGRKTLPTRDGVSSTQGNSGRRLHVDLSNYSGIPENGEDVDAEKGGVSDDDHSLSDTEKIIATMCRLGGTEANARRCMSSISNYYNQSHYVHKESPNIPISRKASSLFWSSEKGGTDRFDAIDSYLLIAIPGRGPGSGFEMVKTGLGNPRDETIPLEGVCNGDSIPQIDTVCHRAFRGDNNHIEITFEVCDLASVLRQNPIADNDSCSIAFVKSLMKNTPGTVGNPSTQKNPTDEGQEVSRSCFTPAKRSCAYYYKYTSDEVGIIRQGFLIQDTLDSARDSALFSTSLMDSRRAGKEGSAVRGESANRSGDASVLGMFYASFFSSRSYLFGNFWHTPRKETRQWITESKNRMPSYFALCSAEHEELVVKGSSCLRHLLGDCFHTTNEGVGSFIYGMCMVIWRGFILLFIVCCLGHIITEVGRSALLITLWKFYTFFVHVCTGVWTDTCVEILKIPESIDKYSLWWYDIGLQLAVRNVVEKDVSDGKHDFKEEEAPQEMEEQLATEDDNITINDNRNSLSSRGTLVETRISAATEELGQLPRKLSRRWRRKSPFEALLKVSSITITYRSLRYSCNTCNNTAGYSPPVCCDYLSP